MNNVIKVVATTVGTDSVNTVSARELHAALEVGKHFHDWIKDRIEKMRFVEGVDYCTVENLSNPDLGNAKSRQQVVKEYFISIDMAKHLALIQNNDKGFEVRNYFIEMEKKAKVVAVSLPNFSNPVEAAEAWIKEFKAKQELALVLEEAKPKICFSDVVTADESKVFSYAKAAKLLKVKPNAFTKWLRDSGYLRKDNTPFAQYGKYIEFAFSRFQKPDGTYAPPTCYVTHKGLYYFNSKLHNVEIKNI
jgi:anti-repressor protein